MHLSIQELPVTLNVPEATIREGDGQDWGGQHIGIETYDQEFDVAPLMKGLPHDMCSSPHWGFVLSGEMQVRYANGNDEVIKANEVYYLPPGHSVLMKPGTKIVEWSDAQEYAKVMEVAFRNFEAANS